MNMDASPWTVLIGRSGPNQRGPGVPWMRARFSGPAGPATRAKTALPSRSRRPGAAPVDESMGPVCARGPTYGRAAPPDGAASPPPLRAHAQVGAAQDASRAVGVEELVEGGQVLGRERLCGGTADAPQGAQGIAGDRLGAGALDVHLDGARAFDGEAGGGQHRSPVGTTVWHVLRV